MAKLLNHLTVVRDGWHNGFPSLAYWQDAYWLGYCKGESHAETPARRCCLLTSTDRQRWLPAAEFRGRDGDGVYCIPIDENRMAALGASSTFNKSRQMREIQHFMSFTRDGYHWEEPTPIMPLNYCAFNIRRHEGLWYALAYLLEGDRRELFLMVSPDLLTWEQRCRIGDPADKINESDICFLPDGEAWVVARTHRPGDPAYFCSAKPPYTNWQIIDLKTRIHAPRILAHKGKFFIAARCLPKEMGEAWPFGHSLCIWELTRGAVKPVLRLPAAGDCAYCGIIEDPRGRVCMAYYSMHAYYLGVLPPFKAVYQTLEPAESVDAAMKFVANDIYFAELELD